MHDHTSTFGIGPCSLVPRPRGWREKWPGIHCLRMREKPQDFWGIVYYRQLTVNFLRYTNLRESADFSRLKDACH